MCRVSDEIGHFVAYKSLYGELSTSHIKPQTNFRRRLNKESQLTAALTVGIKRTDRLQIAETQAKEEIHGLWIYYLI